LQKSVLLAAERIKRLEVQGARNVAITAIKAIEEEAKESKAKQKGEFLRELSEAKDILFASRETEPFMRNAIRYVIHAVEKSDEKKVKELVDLISSVSKAVSKRILKGQKKKSLILVQKESTHLRRFLLTATPQPLVIC